MYRFVFAVLIALPSVSFACRFNPNFRSTPFLVMPSLEEKAAPVPPVIEVSSIKRGYDDGNFASCSDAGIIELKVASDKVGYDISVLEPQEHKSTVPDGLYGAIDEDDGLFIRFIWLDGSQNYQEPLSIRISVRAVSRTGEASEPIELLISHPGGVSR